MLPQEPFIIGSVVLSKLLRVTLHLTPIAGGNDALRHGDPIAPTVYDDALFELGALDVGPGHGALASSSSASHNAVVIGVRHRN